MVLSKFDLKDPLLVQNKFCVSTKTLFVPIDHHAIFKMFQLNFCGSDKKLFGGTSKNLWLDPKVCADLSWLLVFKDGLKKCYSFKKAAILMAENYQKLVMKMFWTPKTPFFV